MTKILTNVVVSLSRQNKTHFFGLYEVVAVLASMFATHLLLRAAIPVPELFIDTIGFTLVLCAIAAVFAWRVGLPSMTLNTYESQGVAKSATASVLLGASAAVMEGLFDMGWPASAIFVFSLLYAAVSVFGRMVLRQITLWAYRMNDRHLRVLVYGAGKTGQQLVAALRTDPLVQPVAFVDDNPTLQSTTISGMRVFASTRLHDLVSDLDIDRVVIAMPSMPPARQARLAHDLGQHGVQAHALPSFAELVGQTNLTDRAAPIALDRLLGRAGRDASLPTVSATYRGRRILVTGAGGSIGSELCRQLLACEPECVVMLDHSELALYSIDKELRELSGDLSLHAVLGSVCDADLVRQTIDAHDIQVVIHAAAYKHLPLVQSNPLAGLDNNVLGTKIVADAARELGVERFILISSDKAVRPTNVMGASKRLAELVVQDLATRSTGTVFSMVRFGNVLGSSGSVIPLFEEQIARGGPVTLTDAGVTRYFMTISEATRLVLLAGSYARGGDVFVLDMGEPVPIRQLAQHMIEGAGFTVRDDANPSGDIEIRTIGLRPGEKLHEELLISPEMLTTPHEKIMRAQEDYLSEIETATALKDLRRAIDQRDVPSAMSVVARWVENGTEASEAVAR